MRLTSYILLLVSFACGIAGSFLVAYAFFWKKPAFVDAKQTIPIIVAKSDIPVGCEIAASHVAFEHVAVDEVPDEAVSRFSDVLYSRALYPISRGYPICRDMLAPRRQQNETEQAKFVPIGFRVVPIEVTQPHTSESLEASERADLMVDHSDNISRFTMMRNETLGEHAVMKRILEGVLIHSVTDVAMNNDSMKHHVVSLLLTNEQYETLVAASQEGKLRIAVASPAPAESITASVPQVAASLPEPVRNAIAAPLVSTPMQPIANPFTETVIDAVPAPAPVAAPKIANAWTALPQVSPPIELPTELPAEPLTTDDAELPGMSSSVTYVSREPALAEASSSEDLPQSTKKSLFVRPNAATLQRPSSQQDSASREQIF